MLIQPRHGRQGLFKKSPDHVATMKASKTIKPVQQITSKKLLNFSWDPSTLHRSMVYTVKAYWYGIQYSKAFKGQVAYSFTIVPNVNAACFLLPGVMLPVCERHALIWNP
jgi:hypothetical protein